jgi:hypothetical protein
VSLPRGFRVLGKIDRSDRYYVAFSHGVNEDGDVIATIFNEYVYEAHHEADEARKRLELETDPLVIDFSHHRTQTVALRQRRPIRQP